MKTSMNSVLIFAAARFLLHGHGAVAQNLVPNPDFDAGLSGWMLSSANNGGTLTLDSSIGSPAPPSAAMTPGATPDTQAFSACFAVSTEQNVDVHADVKNGSQNGQAFVGVYTFGDASCVSGNGAFFLNSCAALPGDGWVHCSKVNYALPAGTQSALVFLTVSQTPAANFDHIGFGPTGTVPVTLQSFEID